MIETLFGLLPVVVVTVLLALWVTGLAREYHSFKRGRNGGR